MSLAASESQNDIAIVGLSCRFPGDASSPSAFWDMLRNGHSGFSESTDRYNADAFHHPQTQGTRQNVIPVRGGYFLRQNIYEFDAAFFNITAAEAVALDPRQRIAMEVAYEALENAGVALQKVRGTQTACFFGVSMSDYRDAVSRDLGHSPKYQILGVSDEMIANRISHFLDIHGPSATVQSACSSSLVSTHIACQSLRTGESEMAIAGGVGLITLTDGTMHLNNLGFLSPQGQSRSFDADANGYGRGEGCGVVVLKRLGDALRDGDTVRAVIRGSGVNSDGWTQGVTMPSMAAQAALIKRVYESNRLDFASTQYVEAHGTGTKVGDPIEVEAIYSTIGQARSPSRKQLYLGSVKQNIGHLEAAAGVASIIKGVLSLENGQIPPNINFTRPNPSIPFDQWGVVVPTKLTPWPAVQTRRMSISGFGMGGTNGHIIMDAYSTPPGLSNGVAAARANKKRLFVFSSHDKVGFKRIGQALAGHLEKIGPAALRPSYLANLSHTLGRARSGLLWRSTFSAENVTELSEQLTSTAGEDAVRAPSAQPRLGFVFTGQGAQWARMGVEMMGRSVFDESVARSARFLRDMGCDWDPVTELRREKKDSRLSMPAISQPICSVLQIALVDELRSWGVIPSRVVGHSSGEIGAAYAMGALSHRDALAAAYFRGTGSAELINKRQFGGMMAVGCSREDVQKLMDDARLTATVACVNSPMSVTMSGDVSTLDALKAVLDQRGIFARRLQVEVAYHSPHMHLCSGVYYNSIADIEQNIAERPPTTMVSSVFGCDVEPEQLGPYYWVQNLINPVLFSDALKEMVSPALGNGQKAVDFLVEVGPHSALGGPIEQILSAHGIENVGYASMLVRGQSARDTSMGLAAELFRRGVPVDVSRVNDDPRCALLTDLPPYPWNHSGAFSAIGRAQREQYFGGSPRHSLLGAMLPAMGERERVWRSFVRLDDEPWLRAHAAGAGGSTTVLFPAAGMVTVALEAARQVADPGKTPSSFRLRDVSFLAAMVLPDDVETEITVRMRPHLLATSGSTPAAWWEFTVSSCAGQTAQLRENCRGLISIVYVESRGPHMAQEDAALEAARIDDYHRVSEGCPDTYTKEDFYDRFAKMGLPYGEPFQGVENIHPGAGKTCYEVRVVDIGETFSRGRTDRPFLISPATLDAVWQGWLGSILHGSVHGDDTDSDKLFLPTFLGEMELSARVPADVGYTMRGSCRSERYSFNEISANINLFDSHLSSVFMSVSDFRMSLVEMEDAAELGEADALEADPAAITSVVRWEYALDLLGPSEISQMISGAGCFENVLQLAQMVIHQHPASTVVELLQGSENITDTILSKLPKGTILPTHGRYVVVDGQDVTPIARDPGELLFGMDTINTFSSATTRPADVFVISQEVLNALKEKLGTILKRLCRHDKPEDHSLVILAAAADAGDDLQAEGLDIVACVPADTGNECVFLCQYSGCDGKKQPHKLTNGNHAPPERITILEPAVRSPELQSFSQQLQDLLGTRGYSVGTKVGLDDAEPEQDTTYVALLELDEPILGALSAPDFHRLRRLWTGCARLLWITCGDHPLLGLVDGLARCVNNEVASTRFQVLHLGSKHTNRGPELAARIVRSSDKVADNEFRERDGHLQVPRVYKSIEDDNHVRRHLEDATRVTSIGDDESCFHLTIGKPGLLDTLHFVRDDGQLATPLADDELELDIRSTGLNFRDIMASMGLVPTTGLGQEASGVVLRAGHRAAASFKPGDRVSTLSVGGTHATRTRCDYRAAVKMPDDMSFEVGAALPMVYATAYFALVKLARVRHGQSVLVHAAAGGVGQAAVQLAKHFGLTVYVTVGTEDKRDLVMKQYGIPEENIFNSRDTSFAKGIRRATGGRGVDCILNSLSGELLRVSWTCLATFGTFVEIGLRDITDNMRLDMRPFGKSATFTSFDIPTMIKEDPAALHEALNDVFQLLNDFKLQTPYPLTTYPAGEVEQAFRTMQQGKHRGKLVLSFDQASKAAVPVLCRARDSLQLDPDSTILFVGGLGGLGRSLAIELSRCGARHFAFLSRSGDAKPDAKACIRELEANGAQVRVFPCDASDQSSFLAAMERCSQQLPPVRGVIQMAVVLRDVLVENMSHEDWAAPLRPKVQGTSNIHQYFGHDRSLDFMIFCSSISGLCGNPGQAQYAAGNTYQDALAHYRRARGLKAASVDLGIMLDVGILADMGSTNFDVWEEALGIRERAFHAAIKSSISGQLQQQHPAAADEQHPAQVALGLGTGDVLARNRLPSPLWFKDVRFGPLAVTSASASATEDGGGGAAPAASLAAKLASAASAKDHSSASGIITGALAAKIAEILRIPVSEVDPGRPMYSYGVDSLVALEVRNWITREAKANMALLDILASVPMEQFAVQIAQKSKLVVGSA